MNPESLHGHEARLQGLERQQSETFRRLGSIETRQAEIGADLRNVVGDVDEIKGDVSKIRNYVDERLKEEGDRRRLSRGEVVTFVGLGVATISAVFAALASLGVFT